MYLGDWTIILLIPVAIFTMWAQAKVSSAYRRYSDVRVRSGITGAEAARRIMNANGINCSIEQIPGELTDHYDPTQQVLRLSAGVAHGDSIASVAVAAHEVGHAIQHAEGYTPIKVRNSIVPVVNFSSKLAWPLIMIGLILGCTTGGPGGILFDIGILMFAAVVLFHAVTLPVELNASSRALDQIVDLGIVSVDERKGAKKVLKAAAMTYLAALAAALMNLIRLLIIRGGDE